ncbi:isoleucine--tRNA ligase [Kribbella sp. CA-293567]|uniref:isoleucine--tRNA ligase n=1 Tax=Kribbella sp. CA-293567 TaxID=3002436 RepID=UPI0022DCF451|nr:isoleucine--tRNA ligase [Kribbella sp. CA-293567]WBQ03649.1 isoleucine--tRNA ligase [Kribbella sp. CA-293567]
MSYPKAGSGGLTPSPVFPAIEERVLAYWEADQTFLASVADRAAGVDGENEFVFYDGPPFANGLPHYGHLLTGYVKDVVPRYQTMRGHRVERRFGWDTHGLPAELEAQRVLGLKTKAEILELGIEKFNEVCRSSVLKYTDDWQAYVTRQARWVDFGNDYKTLNRDYMESVIWAFKTLYDKGLVYEGLRVLPYCWNDETPLSNHELRMDDDVYQPRQDPSVTVAVVLETGERLLAWTTTPWTLPSNLAMAVGPDLDYVVVNDAEGRPTILAEARQAAYGYDEVIRRLKGSELIGLRYTPLFGFFTDAERWGTEQAFQVIAADHVTTENGTGVVHLAPAYGEEDQLACDAAGIPTLLTVDDGARFTTVVPPYAGQHVFDANRPIIRDLQAAGALVREDSYVHSYPHCWRCRNPLIYKAVSSWFVEVTRVRDRMVELNEQITWVPEHVKHGQFGKWLANARDWSISRNRFWGSPIPVWRSDDPAYPRIDVYGSVAELERDFGVAVPDLHRPFIDELTRPNPDDPTGRSTMRRVSDVLDVWFDSGSMSFAQVHYPFENTDWFEHHFPGDFIVEYLGQTRGWFYTMHVLATALFDRPAFSSCLSHGIVLGSDGQKMSKSLRNYPDVREVFDRDGADAMRWFLMSSPILRGGNLVVTEQGIRDGVRQVLIPLWNAWYFFGLYANAASATASWSVSSEVELDRYLLARLRIFVGEVEERLDRYDLASACESVAGYLDVLTNWYIRRSRERFWDEQGESFQAALNTLYTALEVVTRTVAPLLPLTAEEIWRGLTGGRSVHLADWPSVHDLPSDDDLVTRMERIREICSVASAIRKAEGIRGRQPLRTLTVATPDAEALQGLIPILRAEVNVRDVVLAGVDDVDAPVSQKLTVNARAAGPRLGREVQAVIKASKSGDWSVSPSGEVVAGGITLVEGEYTLETTLIDGHSASGLLADGGFVVLDLVLTPELEREGIARDVIRAVQQARRDARLDVTDRIDLRLTADATTRAALEAHRDTLLAETLAATLALTDGDELLIAVEKSA